MRKLLSFVLLMVLCSAISFAQNRRVSVSGTVLDGSDRTIAFIAGQHHGCR